MPEIEIVTDITRCIGCRECLLHCPNEALQLTGQGVLRDRQRCTVCLNCVDRCPSLAHEAVGCHYKIDDVVTEISKELPFFDTAGGGVTFSGGEPLLQPEALLSLLQACKELGIHRTVDTTGFAPTPTVIDIARQADLFLFDLKHMDSDKHRRYTGVPNELILHNLGQLAQTGIPIRIRIPLLVGINDDEQNIDTCARFVSTFPTVQGIDILPYHDLAGRKYRKLERTYATACDLRPTPEQLDAVSEIFRSYGQTVRIGG